MISSYGTQSITGGTKKGTQSRSLKQKVHTGIGGPRPAPGLFCCIPYQSRCTRLELVALTMLINHQKIPSRNSHRTIWWRQFFHGVSTPRCVKLTTKDSQPHVDFWNHLGQLLKSILNSCVIFLLCIHLSFANIRKYLPSTGQEPRYLVLS